MHFRHSQTHMTSENCSKTIKKNNGFPVVPQPVIRVFKENNKNMFQMINVQMKLTES